MTKTTYIYTLADPFTGLVRYVGKADDIRVRFNQHVSLKSKGNTKKRSWIKSLLSKGAKPVMEVVEIVDTSEWKYWEQFYISLFRTWGFNLLNHTNGGEGLLGYKCSEATKEKLRNHNLGKRATEATKEKMRSSSPKFWLGKRRSDEDRKKLSEAQKGKKQTPELIERRMKWMKERGHHFLGKRFTEEHKEKIRQSWVIRKQKRKNGLPN